MYISPRQRRLFAGGGKVTEKEVLARTRTLMQQGARGIVYGRNILQHPEPRRMTQALMAIVHAEATVEEGLAILRGRISGRD